MYVIVIGHATGSFVYACKLAQHSWTRNINQARTFPTEKDAEDFKKRFFRGNKLSVIKSLDEMIITELMNK